MKPKRIILMFILNIVALLTCELYSQEQTRILKDSVQTITKEDLIKQKEKQKKVKEIRDGKQETKDTSGDRKKTFRLGKKSHKAGKKVSD